MQKSSKKSSELPPLFQNPEFILGAHDIDQFPEDDAIEFAFAGRSNVGKSSAINALTNRRKLARTSKTPGRTQQINFFKLNEQTRLVDLPGYGFAQVPLKVKEHWQKTIFTYLAERPNLIILVLLMDIRHPMTELDTKIISWCSEIDLPVHILLTKSDKLKRGKLSATVLQVRKQLKNYSGTFSVAPFSSQDHEGVTETRRFLAEYTQAALDIVEDHVEDENDE